MEPLENKMVLDEYWPDYDISFTEDEDYLDYLDQEWMAENGY